MNGQSIITQGLLLGLASGVTCLASCAPVLLPVLAGTPGTVRKQSVLLAEYLAGRLGGYVLFGLLAWCGVRSLPGVGLENPALRGALDLVLAALMLWYTYAQFRAEASGPNGKTAAGGHSACLVSPWRLRTWLHSRPRLIPVALGLVSGLSLCPPFVVALAKAGRSEGPGGAVLFFLAFFCATSVFFMPFPVLGSFLRSLFSVHVARISGALVGLYLIYSGLCSLLFLFT